MEFFMNEAAPKIIDVAIVGTGFSGLAMAIQLKKDGRESFVVLEKADRVGGTWRENRYPGCACDVPSHLYSFSFEPNPSWTRMFAPQGEILAYLDRCATKYGVMPHIRFKTEVTGAEFDEVEGIWRVQTGLGETLLARHLVLGVGALHRPAYPAIDGLDRFKGHAFHTAVWNSDAPLDGKRVAVIGTGASAIQVVPRLAERASSLTVFQRTPPWVMPKPDHAVPERARRLFEAFPSTQRALRYLIYAVLEARGAGFALHPKLNQLLARMGERHIHRQIQDRELRRAVTPTHVPGCKRVLIADDYYPALTRPNVRLVTDPISHVTERGIVTRSGEEHELDAIIFGTGFRVTELLTHMTIRGLGGVDINEAWRDRVEAYLGTMVTGFPNLYLLMGPNTGLGHNSMVFMIESQVHYALSYMRGIEKEGARYANVRPRKQSTYNERIQRRLARSVWASGCSSWYLDETGQNSTVWPGFTFEFWLRTRRAKMADYELTHRVTEPARP